MDGSRGETHVPPEKGVPSVPHSLASSREIVQLHPGFCSIAQPNNRCIDSAAIAKDRFVKLTSKAILA
jgi:hypothetical protein